MKISESQFDALEFLRDRDIPAVGTIHASILRALVRKGLIELVGDKYKITAEGRSLIPPRPSYY